HPPGHDSHQAGRGGLAILVGDGLHNFCDGILIAAAFLVDPALGWLTAVSIIAHEIPQELGDFIVLVNAGFSRRKALLWNVMSSMLAMLGGVLGYFVLRESMALVPYVLVLAASSFVYIAVADLMPQTEVRTRLPACLPQLGLVAAGVLAVFLVTAPLHQHHHHDGHDPDHGHEQGHDHDHGHESHSH